MWRQKQREQFTKRGPDYGKQNRKDYSRDHRRDERAGAADRLPVDKPREELEVNPVNYDRDRSYEREGAYREPESDRGYVDERERERGYWEGEARDSHYRDDRRRSVDDGYREDRGRAGDESYRQDLDRDRNNYFVYGDVREVNARDIDRDRDYVRDRELSRGRDFSRDRDYGRGEDLDRNRGYDRDRDLAREADYDRNRELHRGVDEVALHREDERDMYRDGRDGYTDDGGDHVGGGQDWVDERSAQQDHWADYRDREQPYRDETDRYHGDGLDTYDDKAHAYRQDRGSRETAEIVGDTRNRLAEEDRAGFRNESSRRGRGINSRNLGSNRDRAGNTRPGRSLQHNKGAPASIHKPARFQAVAGKAVRKFGLRGGHRGQISNLKHSTQANKGRFTQPTSKPADRTNTSSVGKPKSSDDKKSTKGQTISNKDSQHKETKPFIQKSEHASSHYKTSGHTSSSGSNVKPKTEIKIDIKEGRKHSRSESEKVDKSAKGHESHSSRKKRDSHHSADTKLEAKKIYGSFHEEDAISILADDDHFTHETRRYLGTDNVTSGKGKSVSSSKDRTKNTSADYKSDQTRTDRSRDGSKRREDSRDNKSRDTGREQSRDIGARDRNKESYHQQQEHFKAGKVSSASDRGRKTDNSQSDRSGRQGGSDRYRHKHDTGSLRDRNFVSKHTSDNSTSRSRPSSMVNNERVGRTGAILKDDRFDDKKLDKKHSGEGKRRGFRDNKNKHYSDRHRGFHTSDKLKKKYGTGFGKRTNLGYSKKGGDDGDDDGNEHFSKFRNERDERDFEKRRALDDENMLDPNAFGAAEQNQQQIIFIPNADFQDGHAPMLDQYGGSLLSPEVFSGQYQQSGQQQQMPIQFLPSNMAPPEAPPGTEYVFIPFVNDPSVPMPDSVANVIDNMQGGRQDSAALKTQSDSYSQKSRNQETAARKRVKPLTAAQRAKVKWSLMKQRRQQLEKRVEQRILQKLLKKQELEKKNAEKKKPTITRISPPTASTSARSLKDRSRSQKAKREVLEDVSGDDYDNVSDLEDVTDDEAGDYTRSGGKRPTFRKPGEPRLAVGNEPRPTVRSKVVARSNRNDNDQREEWQDTDVRKVVQRQTNTLKRGKTSVNDNGATMAKKLKVISDSHRERPRTPIKITVSNDQFKYAAADDDQDENDDDEGHSSRSRSRGVRSGSREVYEGDRRHQREVDRRQSGTQGKYGKNYRDDRDRAQYSDRKESPRNEPQRQTDNSRGDSRYDDDGSNQNRRDGRYDDGSSNQNRRKSRFSGGEEDNYQNQGGGRNRQGNVSNMGANQGRNNNNNMGGNPLQGNNFNMNNQGQQNFSGPFQQRQMSNLGNQFNSPQSQPFGFQQAGFNQSGFQMGNSDPSLPPVSQGPMNMPPFAQPNPTDMSLPPTVNGPVAGAASPLLMNQNNFPQQNMQMQQQPVFPSAIQNQPFAQQQQQQQRIQQMNQPMLSVGPMQGSGGMSQANLQNSGIQGRGGTGFNASPRYQQSPLRISDQGTNMQQQQQQQPQQQSIVGAIVPSSSQVQGSVQNTLQNQMSRPVVLNAGMITNQQGFMAGQNNNRNDSYMPATANDAMKSTKGIMKSNTSVGSNQCMISQPQQMRQDKAQVFGTVRGGSMSAQRASVPAGLVAMRPKSGANQNHPRINQRSAGGGNGNNMFVSRPRATQASGLGDIDNDVGEMLCIRCDKVFLSESIMRRHTKWHVLAEADIQELRCDPCQQGFTSSVAFNVHMRDKHVAPMVDCSMCDVTFSNTNALTRHMRTVHNK